MARQNRHAPTDIIESGGEHIAAADQAAAANVLRFCGDSCGDDFDRFAAIEGDTLVSLVEAQHAGDVFRRLLIGRHGAIGEDRSFAGVISGEGELEVPVFRQEKLQIGCAGADVFFGIERIPHAETRHGLGHELHQAHGILRRDGLVIEGGLGRDDGEHESGIDVAAAHGARDQAHDLGRWRQILDAHADIRNAVLASYMAGEIAVAARDILPAADKIFRARGLRKNYRQNQAKCEALHKAPNMLPRQGYRQRRRAFQRGGRAELYRVTAAASSHRLHAHRSAWSFRPGCVKPL
jgi:hypothetical protein